MASPEILVVGGTGRIGRELVRLLARDTPVRVLIRSAAAEAEFADSQVETTLGDLNDPTTLESALHDIAKVFVVLRDQPDQVRLEGNLISAAQRAQVSQFVKVSAFAAALEPPPGYGILHAEGEKQLQASGLPWVILRPYVFMQNFLELAAVIAKRGVIPFPVGQGRVGLIDARDIAKVAHTILLSDNHQEKIYQLTGPVALDFSDCAALIAAFLDKPVRHVSPPLWLAGLMMRAQGLSAWDVNMLIPLLRMVKQGGEEALTKDVEIITGEPPRTFETFLTDHRQAFVGAH